MPSPDPIEQQVRQITADVLDVDPAALHPDQLLAADLGMDSLAATELALVLEDELHIRVAQHERDEIRTFGDVVGVVRAKLVAAPPGTPPPPTPLRAGGEGS